MNLSYATAPAVRHVEVDGLLVVLDLAAERYRILDDAASELWPVLLGRRDAEECYAAAAREYDVDEARWRADLNRFARRCVEQGLLVPDGERDGSGKRPAPPPPPPAPPPRTPRRGPAAVRALRCLVDTRRSLRRDGLRATYERYARIPVAQPRAEPLPSALAAFTRAENAFVSERGPGDCLPRSLSLVRFLRSCGCPGEHVIGVRRYPFQAHAWVEVAGTPQLDDRAGRFKPIARMPA